MSTSVILLFAAFIIRTWVEAALPTWIPAIIEYLKIVPVKKVDYLWTSVFTFILTLVGIWGSNLFIFICYRKSAPVEWAVNKHGDEIEKLFKKSLKDGKAIHITMKNNKVYVGFSATIPEPQKTNYLILTPILSGYRDSETKELKFTTNYLEVFEEYVTDMQEESDPGELNMDVIIMKDEILSAGIYEQEIYNMFNKPGSKNDLVLTGQEL